MDLAKEIGCRAEQVSRWQSMEAPPQMRKGFDKKLAAALMTTPGVLFVEWRSREPQEFPLIPHGDLSRASDGDLMKEVAGRWLRARSRLIEELELAVRMNWREFDRAIQSQGKGDRPPEDIQGMSLRLSLAIEDLAFRFDAVAAARWLQRKERTGFEEGHVAGLLRKVWGNPDFRRVFEAVGAPDWAKRIALAVDEMTRRNI